MASICNGQWRTEPRATVRIEDVRAARDLFGFSPAFLGHERGVGALVRPPTPDILSHPFRRINLPSVSNSFVSPIHQTAVAAGELPGRPSASSNQVGGLPPGSTVPSKRPRFEKEMQSRGQPGHLQSQGSRPAAGKLVTLAAPPSLPNALNVAAPASRSQNELPVLQGMHHRSDGADPLDIFDDLTLEIEEPEALFPAITEQLERDSILIDMKRCITHVQSAEKFALEHPLASHHVDIVKTISAAARRLEVRAQALKNPGQGLNEVRELQREFHTVEEIVQQAVSEAFPRVHPGS